MRHRIGELWIGLGIFHLALIAVLARRDLGDIVTAGIFNALGDSPERAAAFWLLYLGVPFFVVGVLARWTQRQLGTVPASLGWATVISGIPGVIVVSISGFPLYLALGIYTIAVARQGATTRGGARHEAAEPDLTRPAR